MAQREEAGEAVDQVERQGQDGVDEDQLEDVDLVVAHIGLGLGQGQTEDDDKRDIEQGRSIEAHWDLLLHALAQQARGLEHKHQHQQDEGECITEARKLRHEGHGHDFHETQGHAADNGAGDGADAAGTRPR